MARFRWTTPEHAIADAAADWKRRPPEARISAVETLRADPRHRATGDLDLLDEPTLVNARRLGRALREFGFPGLADESHRFAEPQDQQTGLGRPKDLLDLALLDGAAPRVRARRRQR